MFNNKILATLDFRAGVWWGSGRVGGGNVVWKWGAGGVTVRVSIAGYMCTGIHIHVLPCLVCAGVDVWGCVRCRIYKFQGFQVNLIGNDLRLTTSSFEIEASMLGLGT